MEKNADDIGNITLSKDLFIETLNEIEKQHNHDHRCYEAFSVILPNDYTSGYDNHLLENQLIKIIRIAMNDNHKDSWIDYYIYELDFGAGFTEGSVTIEDKNFELRTPADLWDLLHIL